jgi:hypothetical protein
MARYDWPASPRSRDDHDGRVAHLSWLRPAADPSLAVLPSAVPTGPARRAKSQRRGVAKNKPSGDQNLWIPIGPSVMVNGQAGGNPNVAGRIRDLQVDRVDGSRVYAASASGGLWYSADRGATWRPLDDWQESPDRAAVGVVANALACGAVHVIWGADEATDEVWVGTGEMAGGAGGSPGGQVAGVGFLHAIGPAKSNPWSVVKGDPPGTGVGRDPTTLRGATVFRIGGDPDDENTLVAGTTRGVYVLSGGTWDRVPANMPGGKYPMDVVVTRPAPNKARIWIAAYSTLVVAEVATPITAANVTAFSAVTLPNITDVPVPPARGTTVATRTQIAATPDGNTLFLLGRRLNRAKETRANPAAHLWSVDTKAAIAGLTATEVDGLPVDLFMSAGDQSHYDMCIATHPTAAGRIYVGGATVGTATGYNGAVYRCETGSTPMVCTMIGEGVHADDHVIRIGPPGPTELTKRTVWVGCDGGLFRSDADGDPGTFSAANDGLAVLEPGYVASHPSNPGIVAAGFQDNGTAVRIGDSVWRQTFGGDGGGLVFHPTEQNRYLRQYTNTTWKASSGSFTPPVKRGKARKASSDSTLRTSETIEDDSSLFYSGADTVGHGGETHLAIGSDRVWYSRNWGASWVTLPTGKDPRGPDNPDVAQDVLDINPTPGLPATYSDTVGSTDCCSTTYVGRATNGLGVIAVKFAKPDDDPVGTHRLRALALNSVSLVWMTGSRSTSATGAFSWVKPTSTAPTPRQRFRDPTAVEKADFDSGKALKFLPAQNLVSDVAVHDANRGDLGSCYVTTIGKPNFTTAGTPDARIDTLWFFDGKDTWTPTGLRMDNPTFGTWTDPAKRVTAPALGVVVDPESPEIVYVATSVGVVKGVLTIGGTPASPMYKWDWDQFMNGLPEAAVQDLSIHWFPRQPPPDDQKLIPPVKLLRAALQARGVWETDLGNTVTSPLTYLRLYQSDTRRRVPTSLSGSTANGEEHPPRWDNSPDIVIDTTGIARVTPPTEAELRTITDVESPGSLGRVAITERHPTAHVLVHHRWPDAAPPADVRVALLRNTLPADGVVSLGGLWPVLVAAAQSGTPPLTLPDGWSQAGPNLFQNPTGPVDVRMPRAVSFPMDWSADRPGTAFVLLAVVMNAPGQQIGPADLLVTPTTNATTADQLVVSSPRVAAKSIELG